MIFKERIIAESLIEAGGVMGSQLLVSNTVPRRQFLAHMVPIS